MTTPTPLVSSLAASSVRSAFTPSVEWTVPSMRQLVNLKPRDITCHRPTSATKKGKSTSDSSSVAGGPSASETNKWLLMTCAGAIEEVSVGSGKRVVTTISLTASVRLLLSHLHAHPGAKDADGHTAVHWLIFSALLEPADDALRFKSKEDPALVACECGGVAPGVDELAAPWLWRLQRYRLEPALELLLAASKEVGFAGDLCVDGWTDEFDTKTSLLDVQDVHGNTCLHYAVAHHRVDLVGLLLLHGANHEIANRENVKVEDLVDWQMVGVHSRCKMNSTPTNGVGGAGFPDDDGDIDMTSFEPPSSASQQTVAVMDSQESMREKKPLSSIHPLIRHLDPSVYSSCTRLIERRWGTADGLRIEACQFEEETSTAAIKRLLFQARLHAAVIAGEDGDLPRVKALVREWSAAYADSTRLRMFPLAYRADAAYAHPLQEASSYVSDSVLVLQKLLRLPFLLHVQVRRFQYAALPLAVVSCNLAAVDLLIRAGANVNLRDALNGKTALHAIAEMRTMSDADAALADGEPLSAREATICRLTRDLLERGADPTIVDQAGNTPLILACARGTVGLVGLYLQWNAMQEARTQPHSASLSAIGASAFVQHANVYGNTALHYSFYRAHSSDRHLQCLQLLYTTCPSSAFLSPQNRAGQIPQQLLAAPETPIGQRVCREVLKQSLATVEAVCAPTRKRVKRRELLADLSGGVERFPVVVLTDFELKSGELDALKSSFTYVLASRLSPSAAERPEEADLPNIDPHATTITEALRTPTTGGRRGGDCQAKPPKKNRTKVKVEGHAGDGSGDDDEEAEDDLTVEWQDDPFETRRLFDRGLLGPMQVRMTPRCGWGLFTQESISKGAFVCEYVGELLPPSAADRRLLEYVRVGSHPVFQLIGVKNLDGDTYTIDPARFGSVCRFVNHSCDANLQCLAMLDDTRLGMYAMCDIPAGEELTCDYAYESDQVGATFICFCGQPNCDRTLL